MSSTDAFFARFGPGYRWLATLTAMVAAVAVVLSSTIVNVAIPAIMGQFGIDSVQAQWLSTGFLAAMTVTMLMTAWCERAFHGSKRTVVPNGAHLPQGGFCIGGQGGSSVRLARDLLKRFQSAARHESRTASFRPCAPPN